MLHSQVPERRISDEFGFEPTRSHLEESKGTMSIIAQAFVTAQACCILPSHATLFAPDMSNHSAIVCNYAATNAVPQYQCEADLWKDSCSGIVCLNDDMLVELGGVHAQR